MVRTADDEFRRRYAASVRVGLIVAVGLHVGVLQLFPAIHVESMGGDGSSETLLLPPEVEVPPPPDRIVQPAIPEVAPVAVDEDVTIAPTTFQAFTAERLPPPPEVDRPSDRPVYIPRDIDPKLQNSEQVLRLLHQLYPEYLQNAGVGGRVILWLWVDRQGRVGKTIVQTSSGLDVLDDAAARVAASMRFSPAINRDKPVAVWITQPITFEVKR